jgi:alpha-glucosidase
MIEQPLTQILQPNPKEDGFFVSESPAWWQTGVVYQVYPRSFKDGNADGVGDLSGLLEQLPYFVELGIDAIWISPFYRSPMKDFGYDVSDYCDIEPVFGDLATFDRLITHAHRLGLNVIVDFVPNHSSCQHPWFRESSSSRDNKKRDWYVWHDGRSNNTPPNNWLSLFGGSAWTFDAHTQQYYLHSFLPEQPDLNWRNPEVEAAMFEALFFWLERGVDGFRLDVAHFILKDPELRDNPPNPEAGTSHHKSLGEYDRFLHLNDSDHPDIHAVYRRLRQQLEARSLATHHKPGQFALIGEIHLFDLDVWKRYYGEHLDEFHMPFNFGLLKTEWNAQAVQASVDALEAALPQGATPNYVLGNHDEHRIASRVGGAQARIAMLLLLTLRGTPTLYYGDELGMTNVPIPPEAIQDPWGQNVPGLGLGRDPERTPMQWNTLPNAGFCPDGIKPWLPVAEDFPVRNVEMQQQDPSSMWNFTKALLFLRRQHAALQIGTYMPLETGNTACYGYTRQHEQATFLVLLNFSDQAQTVWLEQSISSLECGIGSLHILLSTHMDTTGAAPSVLHLRPNEGLLLHFLGDSS